MSKKTWVISGIIAVIVIILGVIGSQVHTRNQQTTQAVKATKIAINKLNDEEYKNDTKKYLKSYSEKNTDVSVVPVSDYSSSDPKFYVTVKYADVDWDNVKYNYKEVSYDEYHRESQNDGKSWGGAVHTLMKVVNGSSKFYVVDGVKTDTIKFKKNTKIYVVNSKTKNIYSTTDASSDSAVYSVNSYKVAKN